MWHDLRFGLRRLARAPVVSLTVTLTLAAGVGALTTAYTVGHGALAPLDYPQPERLVRIYETLRSLKDSPNPRLAVMWNELPVSYSDANDWRHGSRALGGIALYLDYRAVLEAGGEPLEVAAARIDSNLLRVLGVAPELGRPFDAGEVARRERVALLAHDLWTSVFGADRRILGRAVRLDGQQYTVVGVMPAGFGLPGRQGRLWTPAGPRPEDLEHRDEYDYAAVGRLAAGTDREQAQAELDRLASGLAAAYPATNASTGVRLAPLLDTVIGDSRRVVALLAAAAAAVLLVACVNLAHVLLAQGAERRNETALRQAGVLLGTLGALAGRRLLAGLLFGVVAADLRGLAAAGSLLIVTCLAAAYLPARRASQINPAAVLRSE